MRRALLLLVTCLTSPALAAETLFTLNYSGRPDFTALYGWENILVVTDAGYYHNGVLVPVSGRGTTTVAPPQTWCNDVVAGLLANRGPRSRVFLDWETLTQNSLAEMQTFVTQATQWLACFRAASGTTFRYGFYGYLPLSARYSDDELGPSGAGWAALQTDSAPLDALLPLVDFVTFVNYVPSSGYRDESIRRHDANQLMRTRAWMQRLGVRKPIYCWTHQAYSSDTNTDMPHEHYARQIRDAYHGCDGVILWDWFAKSWSTESAKAWWQIVGPPLTTGRPWRPQ